MSVHSAMAEAMETNTAIGIDECNKGDKEESNNNHESRCNSSMKLLSFPHMKVFFESNCKCMICGSPLTLSQETMGIATNLQLRCIPKQAGQVVHISKMSANRYVSSKLDLSL